MNHTRSGSHNSVIKNIPVTSKYNGQYTDCINNLHTGLILSIESIKLIAVHTHTHKYKFSNAIINNKQYLVTAYSLRPLWRLVEVNVPMQPRRRRLWPIFQVTNRGLKTESSPGCSIKNAAANNTANRRIN